MSHKTAHLSMALGGDDADLRLKRLGSENGCYIVSSESDSDSDGGGLDGGNAGDDDQRSGVDAATLARFWSKVNQFGPVPGHCPEVGNCWIWTSNLVRGYGQFLLRLDARVQKNVYAHRFAYTLTHGGTLVPSVKVCHRCDTPSCVRPSHLFIGTQADNLNDARQKGRLVDGLGARKLSDDAYRDILSSAARGHGSEMVRKYGVTKTTISRIKRGKQGSTFHRANQQQPAVARLRVVSRG